MDFYCESFFRKNRKSDVIKMRPCGWEEATEGREVARPLSESIQADLFMKRRNQVTANENEFEVFMKRQGVSVPFSKEGNSRAWSWRLGQIIGGHRGHDKFGIYSNYSGKY